METDGTRCPQCGSSCVPGTAYCPACGAALTAQARIRQIERLLDTAPPDQPPDIAAAEAGPAPIKPAFIPAPITAAEQPAVPEEPLLTDGETAYKPHLGNRLAGFWAAWCSRLGPYRRLLIAAGVLFFCLVIFTVSLTIYRMGYQSSPEGVVRGLQEAIRTQNIDLIYSLVDTQEGQTIELQLQSGAVEPELIDIVYGEREQIAVAMLRPAAAALSSSPYYPAGGLISALIYKRGGQWYIDPYSIGSFGVQLTNTSTVID